MNGHMIPLRESILIEWDLLHNAKVECFAEVQKMKDIIKALEKHLENASQVNLNMESLHTKIQELDEQRNLEENVLGGIPIIKAYDIRLHTLATNECQNLLKNLKKRLSRVQQGS